MGKTKQDTTDYHSGSESSENSDSEDYLPFETSNPVLKENIEALLKQLKEVLLEKEKTKILKGKNPILVSLNKYQKVLERTLPEEHEEYFLKVYKRYRIPILSNKNDRWLRKSQIKITYDDTKIRILLSAIYNVACNLADESEKRLEGFPDDAYEECMDLIRKDIILLHLYRVFREFAPEKDQEQLSSIIREYEEVLGLEPDNSVSTSSKATSAPENPMGALSSLMNNLVSGLSQTAKDNDISPEEMPDFGKMVSSVLENGAIKNAVQALMGSMAEGGVGVGEEGPASFDTVIKGVANSLTSPDFKDTMAKTMASLQEPTEGPKGEEAPIDTTPHTSPNGPASLEPPPFLELPTQSE